MDDAFRPINTKALQQIWYRTGQGSPRSFNE
jgi:hypothetical protein